MFSQVFARKVSASQVTSGANHLLADEVLVLLFRRIALLIRPRN